MIVPPKKPAIQVTFRWEVDLLERIRRVAERTSRTQNAAGELLMQWSVGRAEAELEQLETESAAAIEEAQPSGITPKQPTVQVKFRWHPDLVERIRRVAERTARTQNDAAALLMQWSLSRAEAELEQLEGGK